MKEGGKLYIQYMQAEVKHKGHASEYVLSSDVRVAHA